MRERILILVLLLMTSLGLASPSTFPENAAFFKVGYNGTGIASLGGELLIETIYVDTSIGLETYADFGGLFGAQLSGSVLVLPALGTEPPLALGIGVDLGLSNRATSMHVGPVLGSDLLFVFDLPMTVSAYVAPGYASNQGFSLAWSLQVRYYFEDIALELSSSEILPLSVGIRYVF